ncbi:hypothetical protein, partial [Cytobacillus firmus]
MAELGGAAECVQYLGSLKYGLSDLFGDLSNTFLIISCRSFILSNRFWSLSYIWHKYSLKRTDLSFKTDGAIGSGAYLRESDAYVDRCDAYMHFSIKRRVQLIMIPIIPYKKEHPQVLFKLPGSVLLSQGDSPQ